MFLKGKNVFLAPVLLEDLRGPYLSWINSQDTDVYTEHAQFPHTPQSLLEYYNNKAASKTDLWLAIRTIKANSHIGNIQLTGINWVHRRATFAILLGDLRFSGKGLAAEASVLLLRHAFGKLNLNRIELGVHEDNVAARKLYGKLGFTKEGICRQYFLRNGRHRDRVFMSLLASDFKH